MSVPSYTARAPSDARFGEQPIKIVWRAPHDGDILDDIGAMSMECKYEQLSSAVSVDEILRVTDEYLSTWTTEEIARLPATCRPAGITTYEDIEFWADRLK